MKRRHSMPFGAECREDGAIRFRFWAPAARQVDLLLGDDVLQVAGDNVAAAGGEYVANKEDVHRMAGREKERTTCAVPTSVIDPELNRGGAPRASSGFSMAAFEDHRSLHTNA